MVFQWFSFGFLWILFLFGGFLRFLFISVLPDHLSVRAYPSRQERPAWDVRARVRHRGREGEACHGHRPVRPAASGGKQMGAWSLLLFAWMEGL